MTIRTRPVTKEYAEGWERTFGEKSPARKAERKFLREIEAKLNAPMPNYYLRALDGLRRRGR